VLDERYWVVNEGLCLGIKTVKRLLAADPQFAVAILEQAKDVYSAETVRIVPLVDKNLESVSVKPVQPEFSTKPHKAQIVLHDAADSDL
jgi:hypothetical protein